MEEVTFRKAVREDVPLILEFIKGLAEYEKMSPRKRYWMSGCLTKKRQKLYLR